MRFVWAVAAFVLAAVMIGAGIAQRTIFQGPKTSEAVVSTSEEAPYLLIDGTVLGTLPGTQTLRADADGDIFAAYGRTADIEAWLSDTTYNSVTLDDEGQPTTALVEPAPEPSESTPAATTPPVGGEEPVATEEPAEQADPESETPARGPIGSDLWLDEFQQADVLIAPSSFPPT